MTLNLSRSSIFTPTSSEDVLRSSIRFGKYPDKNFDKLDGLAHSSGRNFNWELDKSFDYRKDDKGSSDDSVSDDILALLPADPFEMDVTATVTAITGWFEGLEKGWSSNSREFGSDEIVVKNGDNPFFAGLNLFLDGAIMFQPEVDKSGFVVDKRLGNELYEGGNGIVSDQVTGFQDGTQHSLESDYGAAHEGLFLALSYLGVHDLLSVERVCKSLRHAVKDDPLLWRNVHIDQSLSDRITDDGLLRLTGRAQGWLQCLSLVECLKITDSGLKRVFECNPGMMKLSVPGCVKLSVEGILSNLKALKSAGAPGIKYLRIGGIYGITNTHFEELKFLLGADNCMKLQSRKPRFYRGGQLYISCNDDCAIDIEVCPKCQELRLVYDCPAESCQGGNYPSQLCRACIICIARCVHCGRCINNCDYEETFCLDLLCLDCWKEILDHQETLEGTPAFSSRHAFFRKDAYHFCFMATNN